MKIRIPFENVATIETKEGVRTVMYVDVTCIPENIPMDCNPRLQNMNSVVVKDMTETLLHEDGLFHILNRGITLTAQDVTLDNEQKVAEINIEDTETQGCIDGGHTYKCILENKFLIQRGMQMVTVEVLTGDVVIQHFVKLAMARNRSQQVQDKSIEELEKGFEWIKQTIQNENVSVVYKENVDGNVSVEFILWLMTVVNPRFGDSTCNARPGACMISYSKYSDYGLSTEKNPYYACKNILVDLMRIYDFIEVHFSDSIKYFSRVSKVKTGKYKSTLYGTPMKYRIPKQFLFPVYTVMSTIIIVDKETGILVWKVNPYEFIERALPVLALHQVEILRNDKLLERCRSKETYKNLHAKGESILKDMIIEKIMSKEEKH